MQIQREDIDGKFIIKRYEPGLVVINDQDYANSVIISRSELIAPWRPTSMGELHEDDFDPIIKLKPEILIFGSGEQHQFCPPKIVGKLAQRAIAVESMTSGAAARTYNLLLSEGRNIALALLIR